MQKQSSIHDVAETAGVSVSTVSNVLNRPQLVATGTRARVLSAIEVLGFQRNPHAASLRLGKPGRRPGNHVQKQPPRAESPGTMANPDQDDTVLELAELAAEGWQYIPPLHPVLVGRSGHNLGSGLAEGSMPDGSGIWVRYDDGRGRQYLTKDDGYLIVPLPTTN